MDLSLRNKVRKGNVRRMKQQQIAIFGAGWLGSSVVAALFNKYELAASIATSGDEGVESCLKRVDESFKELGIAKYFEANKFLKEESGINQSVAKKFEQLKQCLKIKNVESTRISLHAIKAVKNDLQCTITAKNIFYSKKLHVLILCFPPSGVSSLKIRNNGMGNERGDDDENFSFYAKALLQAIAPIAHSERVKVIFVSSTSVYGKHPFNRAIFTEDDAGAPQSRGGKVVWLAEEALRKVLGKRLVCLRLGGLMGGLRHPANIIKKRCGVFAGHEDTCVNLIHRVDAVAAIEKLVHQMVVHKQHSFSKAYNVVAINHPTRRAFYGRVAKKMGRALVFDHSTVKRNDEIKGYEIDFRKVKSSEETRQKIVDSSAIRLQLGFKGIYDDLMGWAEECVKKI